MDMGSINDIISEKTCPRCHDHNIDLVEIDPNDGRYKCPRCKTEYLVRPNLNDVVLKLVNEIDVYHVKVIAQWLDEMHYDVSFFGKKKK